MQGKTRTVGVPAIIAGTLTIVYSCTLAPGVTLWDSGEFLSAIHSLGIPHPPGTPLYILIASVWGRATGALVEFARSVNLLSALATAGGCALLGSAVARWTRSAAAGIAGGLAAGAMLSVWRNATETEVYALAFALASLALILGDRAGETHRWRDAVLAMYALALTVPLHLGALVIAPGVVAFAAMARDGRVDLPKGLTLAGGAVLVMALGTTSIVLGAIGLLVLLAGSLLRKEVGRVVQLRDAAALSAAMVLGATIVFAMYLRARYDPFVNQGNPATWDSLIGVVGRAQYDVPPLWPRRAPLWLQVANVIQYADWQVALGLDDWVGFSLKRTPFSVVFAALAIAGAMWHRARDRRSFRAFAVALASASLGSILVLNLRAGPSIGVGVLPPDALHEARERDYLFAIAFALAAVWAGMGATRFGSWLAARVLRASLAPASAIALATLPFALNWRAADRSHDGPPALAERFARAFLDSAPRDAVLFVAGDNDTYPLWYVQEVATHRRDVTVVTIPLLPAAWYRAELERRYSLAAGPWRGQNATMAALAASALEQGRPLAVANSAPARHRQALGGRWILRGMIFQRLADDGEVPQAARAVRVAGDSLFAGANVREADLMVDTISLSRTIRPARDIGISDPAASYTNLMLGCPLQVRAAIEAGRGSVDPRCNLR